MNRTVFNNALSAISQGVVIAGANQRILYCNQSFADITGYTEDEIVGRNCRFLQGPDSDPETVKAIHEAIANGKPFAGEILNYRKSGMPFWNDLAITPVRDSQSRLSHYVGITRDISEGKKASKKLVELEANYRFLFDHVQAGVVLHGASTEILYANATAAELLGITREMMYGAVDTDPRWGFIREDGSRMPLDEYPVNRAISTASLIKSMVLGLHRLNDQKLTWLLCNAYPVKDEQGKLDRVVVSFTDVTELKQTELALHQSEERLRLVLRGANDAAWDWDITNQKGYYSPRWWGMLGYEPVERSPEFLLWLHLMHPRDRKPVNQALESAMKGDASAFELEFRLKHKNGHWVPVLCRGFILRNATGNPIRISGTNMDLTERKRVEKQIHKIAFYDSLTGLPNRQMLGEIMQRGLDLRTRSGQNGAILVLDIDDFKTLNDTRGHDVGDQLLILVAKRLRNCVRRSDTIARLGGDEFVVLLEWLGSEMSETELLAGSMASKMLKAMSHPFKLGSTVYRCSLSIGIAPFNDDTRGFASIMRQADMAMYQAKAAGRNIVRFFDQGMQEAAEERLTAEEDLRVAMQARQILLYAQPQVDHEGSTTGAEILLRWAHPVRGLVLPGAFIPTAEATGLIVPLGDWVLNSACRRLVHWLRDPYLSKLTLSVNVSVRQFSDVSFVPTVLRALKETGADASKLRLEITESLLAQNIEEVITKMKELIVHGITFSLDDFGTGYSSLSYLQRMPLSELKIDRCFVRDVLTNPQDASIARIIVSLAANMGLRVIAEGVETHGQFEFLNDLGCKSYQGYLFSKAIPLAEFEEITASQK